MERATIREFKRGESAEQRPYSYQDPADYYSTLNHGFSVETGTPSLPTREWFSRWLPEADRWPVSDDWAYHDWHQAGNGDVNPFNQHMEAMFGAANESG